MTDIRSEATSSTPDDSSRPRRRIRFWHVAVIVLLAIVAVPLGLRWHWKGQLRRRIKALAAAGYPTTVEQMDAWYPPLEPDQENLADLIVAVASQIDLDLSEEERELVPLIGQGQLPPPGKPLTTEAREVLNRVIDDHQEVLGSLQRMPAARCRYRLNWSEALNNSFPDLSKARQYASLLSAAAFQAFDEGDPAQATRFLVLAFAVGRSMGEVPLMWARHSSCYCLNWALTVLEWGLTRGPLTDEQLARLTEALGRDDCPEGIARGLAAWRCLVLPSLQHPEEADDDDLPPAPVLDLYRAFGLAAREAVIYIDTVEAYIQAAQLPLSQWQSVAKAADERVRTQVGWCLQLRHLSREGAGFSWQFIRSLTSRARLDAARTALAVERYRLAQGRLPETLTDLVPEYLDSVPVDPFDGAALRYQTLAKGFVVYSVGRDGWDDGGVRPDLARERREGKWDITFTIER